MNRDLLEHLFGGRHGYVFFPYSLVHESGGKPEWKESRAFFWPTDAEAIVSHLQELASKKANIYFSPQVYEYPYRRKEAVFKAQRVLWADLDTCPIDIVTPKPSVAWESSPGRYAALWFLDSDYPLDSVLQACKGIAYEYAEQGADKGGWDATQVLRVPGSINYKYGDGVPGRLLWASTTTYPLTLFPREETHPDLPDVTDTEVLAHWPLPQWVWDELNRKVLPSNDVDRSKALWRIEHAMLDAGMPIMDIVALIWRSAWNKYRDRRDGKAQLLREVLKCEKERKENAGVQAITDAEAHTTESLRQLRVTGFKEFLSTPLQPPRWQVDKFWTLSSLGLVAGEPKAYKSILVTDLALSVASLRPFLDKYIVLEPGPVLYINEENDAALVQDRIFKMAAHKRLLVKSGDVYTLRDIPFYVQNNEGFQLDDPDWRRAVEVYLEKHKISLLILDPFYMMLGEADENDASEVRPMLQWLSSLRQRYGCSVLLVHHYNKSGSDKRPGLRIRGSSVFHGWLENGLYVTRQDIEGKIKIEKEYRSFQSVGFDYVNFVLQDPGKLGYEVYVGDAEKTTALLKEQVVAYFQMGHLEVTAHTLVSRYGASQQGAKAVLDEMVEAGLLECKKLGRKGKGGDAIYVPSGKLFESVQMENKTR